MTEPGVVLNIVDAHVHLGPWPRFYIADSSLSGYLELMDHLGIRYAAVAPHAGLAGLPDLAIRQSEDAYIRSKGRIISYVVYDPNHADRSIDVIQRYLEQPWMAGIKIHPTMHNVPADDERYRPAWELAHERQLVILTHSWDRSADNPAQNNSYPDLFEARIAHYTSAKVILGHAGGRHNAYRASARLARTYEHVWLDLAGDGFEMGRTRYLLGEVSGTRLLYGSDAPWLDPRLVLGEILGANISNDDMDNILGNNAMSLFNLPG